MLNFERYVAVHGEFGVQGIIELLERNEGVCHDIPMPLEDRWDALMKNFAMPPQELAA